MDSSSGKTGKVIRSSGTTAKLSKNAKLNANGGTIEGLVELVGNTAVIDNTDPSNVTVFTGWVSLYGGTIKGGIFTGTVGIASGTIADSAKVTVTFNSDGGSTVAEQKVLRGQKATEPTAPTKAGYEFAGWYNGDTKYDFTKPVMQSITLSARFTLATYTVSLNTNGGTINSGNVTGYTYGQGATLPTADDMTYAGHTFKGWYDNKGLSGSPVAEISNTETDDKEYWAKWEANTYTVTFDTNGGDTITAKDVHWTDTVLNGITPPTKNGWLFIGWKCGNTDVTDTKRYADLADDDTVMNLTLTAQWKDIGAPTGEISIGTDSWRSLLHKITFGLFFKDTQTVSITASDNSGDAVKIEYLLSDKGLTAAELDNATFTVYNNTFSINPDNKYVIYAKLTDTSGNVTYLSSNGIVLDATAPVISGVENGKTYCEAQTVTVTEEYIESVKVNGTEVTLDANNQFTLSPAEGTQTIVVTDKAGNETSVTVTVNNGHTAGNDDSDCSTPVYCIYHPNTVVVAAKSHDFSGEWNNNENGHWHICQNDGCTVAETETPHSGTDDGDCTTAVKCECGYTITAAKSHDFSGAWHNDENGHWHTCQNDGCTVAETETPHSGTDDGDCTTAVKCECGYTITAANAEHTCEWQSGNGKYWQKCKYCDFETAKKDIPTVTIDGADAVCITQDYKFGIILPEGATDALYGYDFEFIGTSGLEPITEDGKLYGAVSAGDYDLGAKSFKVTVTAKTAEGFDISASKTVALKSEHTDAEPKDHICDICGVKFSEHSGGEATCTDKAVCDYCGKEYGELAPNNHTDLEHFPAKAATKTAEGNIEYWYCSDCGNYYKDAAATKEITEADTVTVKLPDDSKLPQTGDNSHMALWIALLFVSCSALFGTAAVIKKRKRGN